MELRMMKTFSKTIAKLTIVTVLFCLFSLPCFAELRRVPASSIVEQGLTAITVDAEGAEDFRYAGLKDKRHTYVGKIKPESRLLKKCKGASHHRSYQSCTSADYRQKRRYGH